MDENLPSTRRQALLPQGAQVLPNPTGTAPGMIWSPQPGFTLLTFPGVPSEMRAMWDVTAGPWLQNSGFASGVFTSRQLHFWGIGESALKLSKSRICWLGAIPPWLPMPGVAR